eukprot:TRINITY_DN10693_c0_g1_i2.p2 TRINITY_DN10693_c0_g1~~TRINITY_DN10693_c0_g1_i2.p2  ORF type:complete len:107 (-),score=18.21 TRINITY_DN10693_c0_g1_i2:152-472(-)
MLAIHSFTPMYEGQKRELEIGVLFNHFDEPADQLAKAFKDAGYRTGMNEPWSGREGFMHALSTKESNQPVHKGLMLEFRQDLLVKPEWRAQVMKPLRKWLVHYHSL